MVVAAAAAVVRAQAVAAMLAAKVPVVVRAHRVVTATTIAMTAAVNSSRRVHSLPARLKARAVVAPWEMACPSNPLAMPTSRVNRVLQPANLTRCAPAWT